MIRMNTRERERENGKHRERQTSNACTRAFPRARLFVSEEEAHGGRASRARQTAMMQRRVTRGAGARENGKGERNTRDKTGKATTGRDPKLAPEDETMSLQAYQKSQCRRSYYQRT